MSEPEREGEIALREDEIALLNHVLSDPEYPVSHCRLFPVSYAIDVNCASNESLPSLLRYPFSFPANFTEPVREVPVKWCHEAISEICVVGWPVYLLFGFSK